MPGGFGGFACCAPAATPSASDYACYWNDPEFDIVTKEVGADGMAIWFEGAYVYLTDTGAIRMVVFYSVFFYTVGNDPLNNPDARSAYSYDFELDPNGDPVDCAAISESGTATLCCTGGTLPGAPICTDPTGVLIEV